MPYAPGGAWGLLCLTMRTWHATSLQKFKNYGNNERIAYCVDIICIKWESGGVQHHYGGFDR